MLSAMSDWLLDALRESCTTHGLDCRIEDGALAIQDGLRLHPRVMAREPANGSARVQVDFHVSSPRLLGLDLLDSFSGIGPTPADAEREALGKFVQGSFDVIAGSLTSRRAEGDEVEWEDWEAANHAWRVCTGPLLMIATRPGARIEGFPEFFAALSELFRARWSPGPHWMRVFVGSLDGERKGFEVLVDGVEWHDGERLLAAHDWIYPPGYASLRHLSIALPR
jgi:hypothetical protein